MSQATIALGTTAIKQIYERALTAKNVDFVCLSSNYSAVVGDWFDTDYSLRLYDGKRVTREVVPDTEDNRQAALEKPATSQVRFTLDVRAETDIILTSTWVALVSFDPAQPGAVIFDDQEVVKTMTNLFAAYWQQAKA